MTPDQLKTARELVAQGWFKQRGGMRWLHNSGHPAGVVHASRRQQLDTSKWTLDLNDDGNGGILLSMFDATTTKAVHVSIILGVVEIQWGVSNEVEADTLAHAAAKALLAVHAAAKALLAVEMDPVRETGDHLVFLADPRWPPPCHHMHCRTCGEVFDMRELDQVVAHEHDGPHEAAGIVGRRVKFMTSGDVPDTESPPMKGVYFDEAADTSIDGDTT